MPIKEKKTLKPTLRQNTSECSHIRPGALSRQATTETPQDTMENGAGRDMRIKPGVCIFFSILVKTAWCLLGIT